jgi:hypothetical protein
VAKKAALVPRNSITATFSGDVAEKMRSFAAEKVAKIARPSARAGVLVFYAEMRMKVPVETGELYGSIYHYFDKNKSTDTKQVYVTGPNKRKAGHWAWIEYGHWLYNQQIDGVWQRSKSNKSARGPGAHDLPGKLTPPKWIPAKPYIRPAFDHVQRAISAAQDKAREMFSKVGSDE